MASYWVYGSMWSMVSMGYITIKEKKNGKNGFGLQIMEKYGVVFVYGMMFACFK